MLQTVRIHEHLVDAEVRDQTEIASGQFLKNRLAACGSTFDDEAAAGASLGWPGHHGFCVIVTLKSRRLDPASYTYNGPDRGSGGCGADVILRTVNVRVPLP